MDIKKPLLVKVEAFIYAFVYSCVGSSATPSSPYSAFPRSAGGFLYKIAGRPVWSGGFLAAVINFPRCRRQSMMSKPV